VLHGQLLPISPWLNEHMDEHRVQVRRFVDTGDHEEWIRFFARGIIAAGQVQVRLTKQLETTRDSLLSTLSEDKSGRVTSITREVLADFIATPVTNNKQISERHRVPISTAANVAKRLISAGLIRRPPAGEEYGKIYISEQVMRVLHRADMPMTDDGSVYGE
jgi:hypothetical protein